MNLYFYTKENCPLCEEAEEKLEMAVQGTNIRWEKRDIYEKDEWLEVYQLRIPVIETAEGTVLQEGIVSYGELLSILKTS
ncbi:glutaredoxin family protein [Alkalicoccus luteus]|uniref:Glutaredoxin family protein n=1 Tax=Alkalicoccus luteus TaxID=1237094 RepID=A0A969PPF8_9BACI|nr:glutaredoxin family protein [Alkalicoccus luteus]NJP37140.1 glutaredoxin family protein [Alkalicoccus luteus]